MGTSVGRPRWARILVTVAGSSIVAMSRRRPPHPAQARTSRANTRRVRSQAQYGVGAGSCRHSTGVERTDHATVGEAREMLLREQRVEQVAGEALKHRAVGVGNRSARGGRAPTVERNPRFSLGAPKSSVIDARLRGEELIEESSSWESCCRRVFYAGI
jgi:hypothetical protein